MWTISFTIVSVIMINDKNDPWFIGARYVARANECHVLDSPTTSRRRIQPLTNGLNFYCRGMNERGENINNESWSTFRKANKISGALFHLISSPKVMDFILKWVFWSFTARDWLMERGAANGSKSAFSHSKPYFPPSLLWCLHCLIL